VAFVAGFVVLSKGHMSAGFVGLSISYAITMTAYLNALLPYRGAAENGMVSVERMQSFVELRREAPPIVQGARPPSKMPF
jgi:ABC-type multidrug transport system fused ATPase/permease subunit